MTSGFKMYTIDLTLKYSSVKISIIDISAVIALWLECKDYFGIEFYSFLRGLYINLAASWL